MLKPYSTGKSVGFTIIEMMLVVAILSILSLIAVPSFKAWLDSTQVRNATAAITNGLQKARGEAIARNRNVEFVIGADTSWTVRMPSGGATIETRPASDGSTNVVRVTTPAAATIVTFNSFGNVVPNVDTSASLTRVTTSIAGSKSLAADIGSGRVKMCDPSLAAGSSPRAC